MSNSLFLIKLQAKACNFIKKEPPKQVLSCEFCEMFKNNFFTEHLRVTASVSGPVENESSLIITIFLVVIAIAVFVEDIFGGGRDLKINFIGTDERRKICKQVTTC